MNGHAQNDSDGVLSGVRDVLARETVLVDFKPIKDSKIGELSASFNIVLGVTPEESDDGKLRGGIGRDKTERDTFTGFCVQFLAFQRKEDVSPARKSSKSSLPQKSIIRIKAF